MPQSTAPFNPQLLTLRHKLSVVFAQVFVLTPHLSHLPLVLSVLGVLVLGVLLYCYKFKKVAVKRARVYQLVFVVIGLTSIIVSYRTLLGVDAGAAFLVLCLIGKLLELNLRRDAYIALILSLFVVASLFLFEQSILYAFLALAGIFAVLWAMVAQNLNPDFIAGQAAIVQDSEKRQARSSKALLLLLARLVLQAVPLLIVLFIFFPRIPPLWSIPISKDRNVTGISDHMSPGDFANLSQSSELAFRVLDRNRQLVQNLPDKSQLYWRGMTFSYFDGRTWVPTKDQRIDTAWPALSYFPPWVQQTYPSKANTGFEYTVLLQPTQQYWLFALDTAYSNTALVGITREYNLKSAQLVYQPFSYDAVMLKKVSKDIDLPDWLRAINVQLPAGNNPQTRAMATDVFNRLQRDPEKYVQFWLSWIRQKNFVYTLQPPVLTGQRIDQFLFETRSGFCEHYASAYTFLMRAAGIPARVVVGYQGGEFSPDKLSWEVRQMDAHAWVEVWLAGRGWVRVDPTAAIAPERIQRGMNNLMQQDQQLFGEGALNQLKYSQMKWLIQARVWSDYASYVWQRDVVGFDQSAQQGFLQRLLGIKGLYAQVMWMLGLIGLVVSSIILWLWWQRRRVHHPLDIPLLRLSKKLSKQGLSRQEHEGMIDWLNRLSQHDEQYHQPAQQLISLYQQARYADAGPGAEKQLHSAIVRIVRRWPKAATGKKLY